MRAMAEGRGEEPVEPGLEKISIEVCPRFDMDGGILEVVELDAEIFTSVEVFDERSVCLNGLFWIFLSQID